MTLHYFCILLFIFTDKLLALALLHTTNWPNFIGNTYIAVFKLISITTTTAAAGTATKLKCIAVWNT